MTGLPGHGSTPGKFQPGGGAPLCKYVCPRCGEQWDSLERKDPDQCVRCREWARPLDAKEKK